MSNQNQRDSRSSTDQILDLLLDALAERQKARRAGIPPSPTDLGPAPSPPRERERASVAPGERAEPAASVPPPRPEPPPSDQQRAPARPASARPTPPPRLPSINMGRMLGRLAILVAVLIVVVNIPVTRYGVSLARIMPESSSLIIRNGLVLKGNGPEIYILEDDKLRWISSLDAFEHMGLTWEDVHAVDDKFLERFEKGRPIHVLLKCDDSPHIYRLENDQKRWIKDIDTFLAEGHVWEDVRLVDCAYLRSIPNGPPIPEDAGPPPEP